MKNRDDQARIEAMAKAIADDVYSNFTPEQREDGDHEIWLSSATAALTALRNHEGRKG